jgi:hypothetical protein
MSNLKPPTNQTLNKRPSDDDLGKERLEEKRASNKAEIKFVLAKRRIMKSQKDWVQRGPIRIRRRQTEFYCCGCDEINPSLDGGETCHACTHPRCIFCLQHD